MNRKDRGFEIFLPFSRSVFFALLLYYLHQRSHVAQRESHSAVAIVSFPLDDRAMIRCHNTLKSCLVIGDHCFVGIDVTFVEKDFVKFRELADDVAEVDVEDFALPSESANRVDDRVRSHL